MALKNRLNRRLLRALHRDAGYLIIGLTFVYALSGLAINHVEDWDPNFQNFESVTALTPALAERIRKSAGQAPKKQAEVVLSVLQRKEAIRDAYEVDDAHLEVTLAESTLFVDLSSKTIREEGQKPRLLLRAANWLHLNRGKKAWTYIADGYAVLLLFLATSGLFMFPGRKGIFGRAGILALVGASVPVLYVVLSGGP